MGATWLLCLGGAGLFCKGCFPLGEILRAERNFSLSVRFRAEVMWEKFSPARKIPPSGKY